MNSGNKQFLSRQENAQHCCGCGVQLNWFASDFSSWRRVMNVMWWELWREPRLWRLMLESSFWESKLPRFVRLAHRAFCVLETCAWQSLSLSSMSRFVLLAYIIYWSHAGRREVWRSHRESERGRESGIIGGNCRIERWVKTSGCDRQFYYVM